MTMTYRYFGNCVCSTAEWIHQLRDNSRMITWRTFKRHIPEAREFFVQAGGFDPKVTDKQIEESGFFSFNRGYHRGIPCYWVGWSGYEWIWEKV